MIRKPGPVGAVDRDPSSVALTEADDSVSRRRLVTSLMGGLGAAAFLGCDAVASDTSGSDLTGAVQSALSGATSVRWCDTMLEQQAVTGGTKASAVNVCIRRGYAAPADGGGGVFVWTPDCNTPQSSDPLGGVVVVPTGKRTGCWKRLFSGALDVRWFGAKGDGLADDGPAIQKAVDAAALGGLPVRVPAGRFKVTCGQSGSGLPNGMRAGVLVPDGVTVFGEGRASVIYAPGGDPAPTFCSTFVLPGSFTEIRGLCFRGDNGDGDGVGFVFGSRSAAAISAFGFQKHDVSVLGCWFENIFGYSVYNKTPETSTLSRCRFNGNTMRWNGNGLSCSGALSEYVGNDMFESGQLEARGHQCVVSGNRMAGVRNEGICVYGDSVIVQGNEVDMALVASPSLSAQGILLVGTHQATVAGNTIKDPPSTAIQANFDRLSGRFPEGISITGNTVLCARTTVVGAASTLLILGSQVSGLVVSGNCLSGVLGSNFSTIMGIGLFSCVGATVDDNVITNIGIAGIDLENDTTSVVIQGNVIRNATTAGILVQIGCSNVKLIANDCAGAVTDIRIDSGATGVRLIGNDALTYSLDSAAVRYAAGNSWQD